MLDYQCCFLFTGKWHPHIEVHAVHGLSLPPTDGLVGNEPGNVLRTRKLDTMGLFQRNDNKKSGRGRKNTKQSRKRQSSLDREAWSPENTLFAIKLAGTVIVLGLLAIGWHYTEGALKARVGQQRSADLKIAFETPIQLWKDAQDEIHLIAMEQLDGDPFNAASLKAVGEKLQENPWVKQLHNVKRESEGVVRVSLTPRRIAGFVKVENQYFMIDDECHFLPRILDFKDTQRWNIPIIAGVQHEAPVPGMKWDGEDVMAGLWLGWLMQQNGYANQVSLIDVSNFNGRLNRNQSHLMIRTASGAVAWGRGPGKDNNEPRIQQKLVTLNQLNQRYGSIDAGGQIVTLYTPRPRTNPRGTANAD